MATRFLNRNYKIRLGEDNNSLVWLIIVNVVTFVLLQFVWVFVLLENGKETAEAVFRQSLYHWITLPASFDSLLQKPWTILTYMFVSNSVLTTLSNMLWLWCFGYILQDMAGNKKLFPIYLYGGVIGALVFLLLGNLVPAFAAEGSFYLAGPGTAIMCIAAAATTLSPDFRFFPQLNGGIPLWIVSLIYAAISFSTVTANSPALSIAYMASALLGFIIIRQLNNGKDWSAWLNNFADWFINLFNPDKKPISKHKGKEMFYKVSREPYKKTSHLTQPKLDEILDRINAIGYDNLTEEEKDFLKQASRGDS